MTETNADMIAIVDYKAGNLTSVQLAFAALGADAEVTSDPAKILAADRVVFPGVGAAKSAMANMRTLGLEPVLRETAASGKPFLGICLGTQILFDTTEEDGGVDMLGLVPGRVLKFRPSDKCDKVPEIGWNQVDTAATPHPLFNGIPSGSDFYFVHSYYPEMNPFAIGATEYAGVKFASAVARGNVAATQFHPEKSGRIGLKLLANFLEWKPC